MDKQNKLEELRKKKDEYVSEGEIQSSGKRILELLRNKDGDLFVKKRFEYNSERGENFYFKRELSCMVEACYRGFPFVPLVEFEYPTRTEEGYIIMPFMEGGNVMRQIIDKNKDDSLVEMSSSDLCFSDDLPQFALKSRQMAHIDLNDTRKMIIIYGTAKAISFLHLQEPQIIHRDIKPENVLLDKNGEPYLSDYGFARQINKKEKLSSIKGTPPYMSPELIKDEPVDVKADIYSFGVFMIMLAAEKLTITEKNREINFYKLFPKKQMQLVIGGVKYNIPDTVPQVIRQLMLDCCEYDPTKRPTIAQVLTVLEDDRVTSLFDQQYTDYISKFSKK